MRTLILVLTLALLTPTTLAGVVDCSALTATQRRQAEAIGACSSAAPKSLCLPATDEGLSALLDLFADEANYQTTVPCTTTRTLDDFGILTEAGPGDGACTAELAETRTEISNPQPKRQVAIRWWRAQLNDRIGQRAAERAAETERERVRGETRDALADTDDESVGP